MVDTILVRYAVWNRYALVKLICRVKKIKEVGNMNKHWIVVGLTAGMLLIASGAQARVVNVVLKSSSVLNGELIGTSASAVFIKVHGSAREISVSEINEVFDVASGEPVAWRRTVNAKSVLAGNSPTPAAVPTAETTAPVSTGISLAPTPAPEPAQTLKTHISASPGNAQLSGDNGWVSFDLGVTMGYSTSPNEQAVHLWQQLVPSKAYEDINRMQLSFNFDFLVNLFDAVSVGPFIDWMPVSPGMESTLTYRGGYYMYSNGTWYYIDYGDKEVHYLMDFNNISYGGMARFWILSQKDVGISWEIAYGRMELSGAGYTVTVDDVPVQNADYIGSTPFWRTALCVEAREGHFRYGTRLGYQAAHFSSFTARITQNDYYPSEVGQNIVATDSRDGSKIQVDLSGLIMNIYMAVDF
jgi:hypothetical protein